MACRTNSENIRIEPCYYTWQQQEVTSVDCIADSSSSLNNTYFSIYDVDDTQYYVWNNVASGGIDPAVSGATGLEVTFAADATAATVATAVAAAVAADDAFYARVDDCDSSKVIIMAKEAGDVTASSDSGTTGFTIATDRAGFKFELGHVSGDVELALTEDIADVNSQQTGTQIIAGLRTGRNIDAISLSLQESDAAKLKKIIEASGVEVTPSGGTAVSAWGSEDTKAFANVLDNCGALVLHPIRKGASELSEDICFWRTYPLLTGLAISGESPRLINVDFRVFPDQLLDEKARQVVFGDHTQDFLNDIS